MRGVVVGDALEPNLTMCESIFIPLNITQNHWVLIVVNIKDFNMVCYDSLAGCPSTTELVKQFMGELLLFLYDYYFEKEGEINRMLVNYVFYPTGIVRQQVNSYDCGVYICMYMDYLCNGLDVSIIKGNAHLLSTYREAIMVAVYEQNLPPVIEAPPAPTAEQIELEQAIAMSLAPLAASSPATSSRGVPLTASSPATSGRGVPLKDSSPPASLCGALLTASGPAASDPPAASSRAAPLSASGRIPTVTFRDPTPAPFVTIRDPNALNRGPTAAQNGWVMANALCVSMYGKECDINPRNSPHRKLSFFNAVFHMLKELRPVGLCGSALELIDEFNQYCAVNASMIMTHLAAVGDTPDVVVKKFDEFLNLDHANYLYIVVVAAMLKATFIVVSPIDVEIYSSSWEGFPSRFTHRVPIHIGTVDLCFRRTKDASPENKRAYPSGSIQPPPIVHRVNLG